MKKFLPLLVISALLFTLLSDVGSVNVFADDNPTPYYNLPAEFTVTSLPITDWIKPFTFTSEDKVWGSESSVTNQTIANGAFEPGEIRNRLNARAGSGGHTIVDWNSALTYGGTFSQGLFDGGTAQVFRPRNGRLELVRFSEIESFNASGGWFLGPPWEWRTPGIAASEAPFAYVGFNNGERPNVNYYFAVAAINAQNQISEVSNYVPVFRRTNGWTSSATAMNRNNTVGNVYHNGLQRVTSDVLGRPYIHTYSADVQGQGARLEWDPVPGAVRYVILRAYFPEEEQHGFNIVLKPYDLRDDVNEVEYIREHDLVIVQRTFYTWSRNSGMSPIRWGQNNNIGSYGLWPMLGVGAMNGTGNPFLVSSELDGSVDTSAPFPITFDWRLQRHRDPIVGRHVSVEGGVISAEEIYVPFINAGETYMQINFHERTRRTPANQQNQARISQRAVATPGNGWDRALIHGETYRIEFWGKSTGSNSEVRVHFNAFMSPQNANMPTVTLTNEWQLFSFDIVHNAALHPPNYSLSIIHMDIFNNDDTVNDEPISQNNPVRVSIDGWSMFHLCESNPPNQWSTSVIEHARASGFSYARDHTFIKSRRMTYSMANLLNPSGAFRNTQVSTTVTTTTMDSFMRNIQAARMNPWLQIEFHMDPDEWLGWVEWMAADFDPALHTNDPNDPQGREYRPWAYRRFITGQITPWADEFESILLEISNETWQPETATAFVPWIFNGQTMVDQATNRVYSDAEIYGLFHEMVIQLIASSPHFERLNGGVGLNEPGSKFQSVLGGFYVWAHDPGMAWEMRAGQHTPSANFHTRSQYNGGWDEGITLGDDDVGYFATGVFGPQGNARMSQRFLDSARLFGDDRPLGTYEAGPGYVWPGSTAGNNVQKSQTSAMANLDSFLMNAAYYRYVIQNWFTFSSGTSYWTSHTTAAHGGHEHLPFTAMTIFNNYATGQFMRVDTESVPRMFIPLVQGPHHRRNSVPDAPMIAVYATRDESKYSVFVLSRKQPTRPVRVMPQFEHLDWWEQSIERWEFETDEDYGWTPVTLNLPFDDVHRINVRRLAGEFDENNIHALNVHTEEFEISTDFFDNGRFVLNQDTGAFEEGVGPAHIFQIDFYLDFDGLPEQPVIEVERIGDNDVITWNDGIADLDARMFFIFASDSPDGPFIREAVAIDNVSSVTLPHTGIDRYYRVRIFKYGGYRDSLVMSHNGDEMSDPEDNDVERIPEHDPPPPPPTLLVWDDFRFPDGTEPEDNTHVEHRQPWNVIQSRLGFTGGPAHGWSDDGWYIASVGHAFVHNANENLDRVPMTYGNLLTSGISMTVNGAYQEFRRNLQRSTVAVQPPALNDYIANESWNWNPNIGAINNTTLWFSALMRNPDPENRGGYIIFSHGGGRGGSQLAVGLFRDQIFDMNAPHDRIADHNYWGVKYTRTPSVLHQSHAFINGADYFNGWNSVHEYVEHATTLLTELQAEANETVLVVGRFHFRHGQDTATIWFNPDKDSLGGPETEPTGGYRINVSFPANVHFRPNTIAFQSTDFGWVDFSDLRFASDFAGATPVASLCECCGLVGCDCDENCPVGIIMVEENDGIFIDSLAFHNHRVGLNPFTAIISMFENGRLEEAFVIEDIEYYDLTVVNNNVSSVSFRYRNIEWLPNRTFRAFLWDGFGDMIPLMPNVFEYPSVFAQ